MKSRRPSQRRDRAKALPRGRAGAFFAGGAFGIPPKTVLAGRTFRPFFAPEGADFLSRGIPPNTVFAGRIFRTLGASFFGAARFFAADFRGGVFPAEDFFPGRALTDFGEAGFRGAAFFAGRGLRDFPGGDFSAAAFLGEAAFFAGRALAAFGSGAFFSSFPGLVLMDFAGAGSGETAFSLAGGFAGAARRRRRRAAFRGGETRGVRTRSAGLGGPKIQFVSVPPSVWAMWVEIIRISSGRKADWDIVPKARSSSALRTARIASDRADTSWISARSRRRSPSTPLLSVLAVTSATRSARSAGKAGGAGTGEAAADEASTLRDTVSAIFSAISSATVTGGAALRRPGSSAGAGPPRSTAQERPSRNFRSTSSFRAFTASASPEASTVESRRPARRSANSVHSPASRVTINRSSSTRSSGFTPAASDARRISRSISKGRSTRRAGMTARAVATAMSSKDTVSPGRRAAGGVDRISERICSTCCRTRISRSGAPGLTSMPTPASSLPLYRPSSGAKFSIFPSFPVTIPPFGHPSECELELIAMTIQTLVLLAALLPQANDKTRANSYDDAWENNWVTHCRTVLSGGTGKTAGFVLQVGDSITHSNPYSQWPRSRTGASAEDTAILNWIKSTDGFPISNNGDTSNKNGFYLAAADTSGIRGMTAASGLDTIEALSGDGNGGTAMPVESDPATARTRVADGATYTGNLNFYTMAAAFNDAQFAVVMLGTNDMSAGRAVNTTINNLAGIVDALEARNIVVILSTIPPHPTQGALATSYNAAIRTLAQSRQLPLIDFEAEILARRPGTTWNGTLLVLNDVHPSASGGGFDSASSPYLDGGDSATHLTGTSCSNVGYLLRSWLTVQKLKEVKSYVVDGVNPPTLPPPPPPPPPPPAGADPTDSENGDNSLNDTVCGGSVGAAMPGWPGALALAAALLTAAGIRRNGRPARRPAR